MNTWVYLILIVALLTVATLMMYAKFASRSRENSLHHVPGAWALLPEAAGEVAAASAMQENHLRWEGSSEAEGSSGALEPSGAGAEEPVIRAEPIADPATGSETQGGGDYYDDLQEAAAGLAELMRSTPAAQPAGPVVYAPEGAEEAEEAEQEEKPASDSGAGADEAAAALSLREAAPESTDADCSAEGDVDKGAGSEEIVGEGMEATEPVNERKPSESTVADLLGEEVGERFGRIDAGLDALEELVGHIEEHLAPRLEASEDDEEAPAGEGEAFRVEDAA